MQQNTAPISEIVFITHPAWPATVKSIAHTDKFYRRTPAQIKDHFENEIAPRIRKFGKGTLIVLVKNPPDAGEAQNIITRKAMNQEAKKGAPVKMTAGVKRMVSTVRRMHKESASRERKAQGVEKYIEARIKEIHTGRFFATSGKNLGYTKESIAMEVQKWIYRNKIQIAPSVAVRGMGAWREQCATRYPQTMTNLLKSGSKRNAKFELIKEATIPATQRKGNFRTKTHLHTQGR